MMTDWELGWQWEGSAAFEYSCCSCSARISAHTMKNRAKANTTYIAEMLFPFRAMKFTDTTTVPIDERV